MNTNVKTIEKQAKSENCIKKSRAEYRREKKAAVKVKESKSKSGKVQGSKQALYDEELLRKIDEITENLKAKTWRDLETVGKFKKNEKISFICDDMLIVGCDIGSELILSLYSFTFIVFFSLSPLFIATFSRNDNFNIVRSGAYCSSTFGSSHPC